MGWNFLRAPATRQDDKLKIAQPLPVQHPATDLQFYSQHLVSKIARTPGRRISRARSPLGARSEPELCATEP